MVFTLFICIHIFDECTTSGDFVHARPSTLNMFTQAGKELTM